MPPQHPAPYGHGDHVQYSVFGGAMKAGFIRDVVTTNGIPQERYYLIVENQNDLNNPAVVPEVINYIFIEQQPHLQQQQQQQQHHQGAAVGGRRRKSRRAAHKSRRSGRKSHRSTRRR